jgi:hypothetical protein
MRFGIGMNTDHTLEEVGQQFSVTRERIRQIEAKALRKLKHPSRSARCAAYPVPVVPLDALNLDPDVIKIDVQGTETEVVMGAIETLRRAQPAVIVERPSDAFVSIVDRLGLAPFGLRGRRLFAGDLTGKNTLFLGKRQQQILGLC